MEFREIIDELVDTAFVSGAQELVSLPENEDETGVLNRAHLHLAKPISSGDLSTCLPLISIVQARTHAHFMIRHIIKCFTALSVHALIHIFLFWELGDPNSPRQYANSRQMVLTLLVFSADFVEMAYVYNQQWSESTAVFHKQSKGFIRGYLNLVFALPFIKLGIFTCSGRGTFDGVSTPILFGDILQDKTTEY